MTPTDQEGKIMKNKKWEEFKAKKRRETVLQMKENGITYEEADDAFLDMMGEINLRREKKAVSIIIHCFFL